MNYSRLFTRVMVVAVILVVLILLAGCAPEGRKDKEVPAVEFPYLPLLSEIMPAPTGEAPAWIEFHNPSKKQIKASDLKIVINGQFDYRIPKELPPVPENGFILLKLDGEGAKANDYVFKDGTAVLHSPAALKGILGKRPGYIAVYKTVVEDSFKLVGFVAWGAPAPKSSLNLERHRIWRSRWFVNMAQSFGVFAKETAVKEGYSIGLYPGSKTTHLTNWIVYTDVESTPGKINAVPQPTVFTLSDGATVRSEDIAIGWAPIKQVQKYKFQLAKDPDFKSILDEQLLESALYKPEKLPEGTYFYRVKAIDAQGRQSMWSKPRKVIGRKMVPKGRGGSIGAVEEKILDTVEFRRQRKDSDLLCLDGCASEQDATTVDHWDNVHLDDVPIPGVDHGYMNCVRASTSMMVTFYGKNLCQDRISYFTEEERAGVGDGEPENDLAHFTGMWYNDVTPCVEWALDETVYHTSGTPSFTEIRGWIDNDRPIMTVTPNHMRVIDGYQVDDDSEEWVHIMDPWSGPRWETYVTWDLNDNGVWVGPVSAPNAREDELEIERDSDGDGIMDFDEQVRFLTGRFKDDSDNDDVHDKDDIREYVFNAADNYNKRDADFDIDGVRKEEDPDNDADTYNDGCEDANRNGKYEPGLGETNNFDPADGHPCSEIPIHAIIVFDRSGSMVYPPSDPVKKFDEAASAAALFLDTWLANSPPANTKVGLVFYDHTAYFDTDASNNTTLDFLTDAKRDQINAAFITNRPDHGSTSIGGGILEAMGNNGFDIDSVPADDQHRVIVVLTDGKENASPRMDDPAVISRIVEGRVDGYVLGIGDETQINADKLNDLADILNHTPASFAKDLDAFELEKFFLQVLAETRGMEFSVDPADEIAVGETKSRTVPVSMGTDRVTFVVVWNRPSVELNFTLLDPDGRTITPDVTKQNQLYRVSTKNNPRSGNWTVLITATATGEGTPPATAPYSLMVLEQNPITYSHFEIRGNYFVSGQPWLLIANFSLEGQPIYWADVMVEVTYPDIGWGSFLADARIRVDKSLKSPERDALTPLDQKLYQMSAMKMIPRKVKSIIKLNDAGIKGDEIPGDGKYTGVFDRTRFDGIYTARFIMKDSSKYVLSREKTLTALVRPRVHPERSKLVVKESSFRRETNDTFFKLRVIPIDRFNNRVGPGKANLIKFDIEQAKILNIQDNLDGSYDVKLSVKGRYQGKIRLSPVQHQFEYLKKIRK